MRAKAKYAVIYRYREQYPVSVMCRFFSVSRSGYYGFVKRMNRPERGAARAGNNPAAARQMLSYLWLPADGSMAEGSGKGLPQPQSTSHACYENTACWQNSPPRNGSEWAATANTRIFSTGLSRRSTKPQMGDRRHTPHSQTKQGTLYLSAIRDL